MEGSENELRVSSESKTADQVSQQSSGIPGDGRCRLPSTDRVPNSSSVLSGSKIPLTSTQCSSVSVGGPSNLTPWVNSAGLPDFSIPGTTSAPNCIPGGKPFAMPSRGVFLAPPMPGVMPASLSHFPTDSAFIERAARFSCFVGGGSMVSPFGPMPSYPNVNMDMLGTQLQRTDSNIAEAKDSFNHNDHGLKSGSPVKSLNGGGRTNVGASNNELSRANLAESSQEGTPQAVDPVGGSSPAELNSKKRKKINQETEPNQVHGATRQSVEKTENKQNTDQNESKTDRKPVEDSSEGGKDGYIHIRARRGQATNSHSLAERVRREKISERMKYLQDLVPGCSKVTGKAVMLDEIINYVQSLQRQVEFLSMKLAAVNPRLDFNVDGLIAGDFLHCRAGPSSAVGFSPDMIHPQLHLSQHSLAQPGNSGMASEAFRRMRDAQLNTMGSYKEPMLQMHGSWDAELQHIMQSSYEANPQELNNKARDRFQAYDHQWQNS